MVRRSIKKVAIHTGLYRPIRWVQRKLDSAGRQRHLQRIELYRSLIPAGSLCFDVGANIGSMSEALLKIGARVVAFEPNPTVLPELRARCGRNPNWSLVTSALGSAADIATLYERKSHGQSSLDPDWEGEVIHTHYVPVITLDAAIAKFGVPSYCKIDVEGHEEQVFLGLSQSIPLLSFEFHMTDRDIAKTLACLKRLQTYGAIVNVTLAESSVFYFKEWMPLAAFIAQFPQDLQKTPYGDVWVRTNR